MTAEMNRFDHLLVHISYLSLGIDDRTVYDEIPVVEATVAG